MLKLFVSAVELTLPLGLLCAVLIANRSYPPTARRRVGRLTVAVLLVSAAAAGVVVWLRLTTNLVRLPAINLWVGTVLVLAQLGFLICLWLPGTTTLVADDRGRAGRILNAAAILTLGLTVLLFGIPLGMGSDAVVPMNGSLFDSEAILNLVGYLAGIGLCVVVGWATAVSLGRVPALVRRLVTTLIVGIALVGLWAPLYQQYVSAKLLPRNSLNFATVLWLQRNSGIVLLSYLVLAAVPAVVALVVRRRSAAPGAAPAEQRLVLADTLSRRRFLGASLAAGVGLAAAVTVGKQIAQAVPELSAIEPSVVNGDKVEIAIEAVSDGHLHRFAYESTTQVEVRFIVIQKNSTAFGTGLDACEICGPSGYYERDGKVVCRKCDVVMNIQTIGFAGGCNPIPLAYELADGLIRFEVSELEQHARVFS